mgnify:CR=1 FL=1
MRKLSLFLVSFKIPPAISLWLFVNSSFSKNSNVSEMFFEQTSPMLIEPTFTFNEESLSLFPLQPSQTPCAHKAFNPSSYSKRLGLLIPSLKLRNNPFPFSFICSRKVRAIIIHINFFTT